MRASCAHATASAIWRLLARPSTSKVYLLCSNWAVPFSVMISGGLTLLGAPETESVLREGIVEAARVGLPLQAATHQQNLGLVLALVVRWGGLSLMVTFHLTLPLGFQSFHQSF